MSSRSDLFRSFLSDRVLVADGAMGTMLQAADPSLDDFQGHEGCNEILNVTRPDVVRAVHDAYFEVGSDAVETNTFGANYANLAETSQDLLQTKAAVVGAKRAMAKTGKRVVLIAQVTVELTGTMLMGSEIGAALTALEPLGIDVIGMNCATGPAEMGEHLRYLSQHATVPLSVMPNAGLPELGKNGAEYPLQPAELATALESFVTEYGVGLVGGCCGTTPEHLRQVVDRVRGREVVERTPEVEPAAASLYSAVPFRQDAGVLMVGERTNTNGSKAFREAMLAA